MRRWGVTSLLITVAFGAMGCGSEVARVSDSPALTAVPGGAPVAPSSGAAALCSRLADSGLLGLSHALDEMAVRDTASAGATKVRRASDEIRGLASGVDEPLRAAMLDTASALDKVAADGVTDQAAVQKLADTLEHLGQEVQAECHFQIG